MVVEATIDAPMERPAQVPAASALLSVVEATLRDRHAGRPDLPPVTLDSVLDQDLGFDSLGRMELLLRTERAFGIDLPEDTLQRAETVSDLLRAVQRGASARDPASNDSAMAPTSAVAARLPDTGQDGTPLAAATLLEVLDWHLKAHP